MMNREKIDIPFLLEELTNSIVAINNDMLISAFDISYSEWRLLLAVFLSQENPTQEEVANQAGKSTAAVSRQIKIIEQKGLVKRSNSKESKRIKLVKLTEKGKDTFNKSLMLVSNKSKEIFDVLGSDKTPFKQCIIDVIGKIEEEFTD